MISDERRKLIDDLLEGQISEADFLRLEAELTVDPEARREYYERLALSALLETAAGGNQRKLVPLPTPARSRTAWWAMAAALIGAIGLGALLFFRPTGSGLRQVSVPVEQQASGFGVIASQANAVWGGHARLTEGALLPEGVLELESGLAQLELFSGVTLIAQGPASFEIVSPMEMTVTSGKLRAHVPEPAQGFRIRTDAGEVVDLGTEFAIEASPSHAEVHVLDGEVEWHPEAKPMRALKKGEALRWSKAGDGAPLRADPSGFADVTELRDQLALLRRDRRESWRQFSGRLQADPRLVAHYRMQPRNGPGRQLENLAAARTDAPGRGAVVAARPAGDRWGNAEHALDFSPTGSRVRLNVPGEYRSLTLLCWVKINSLDRWYNSLFLTDGHDLNEPHWQIMDDGRLFFSAKKFADGGLNRPDKHDFFSPPFWNPSLSGQWFMLGVTYDGDARRVTHFVNGRAIGSEAVPEEYLVDAVTIGGASIGNWSEPAYRQDPEFAVRNFNGVIDEFALFGAALSPQEIEDIYEHGRP